MYDIILIVSLFARSYYLYKAYIERAEKTNKVLFLYFYIVTTSVLVMMFYYLYLKL